MVDSYEEQLERGQRKEQLPCGVIAGAECQHEVLQIDDSLIDAMVFLSNDVRQLMMIK